MKESKNEFFITVSSEQVRGDIANSFNGLEASDEESVYKKIEELKRGGYENLASSLSKMLLKYKKLKEEGR